MHHHPPPLENSRLSMSFCVITMRTVYYRPNRPKSLAHDIIFPPTSTSCIKLELVLCDFVNVEQFSILNWKSGYIGGPVNFLKSWVFEFEVGFNEVSEKGWGALTRAACLRSFLYFQFPFWIFKWHLRLNLKLKFKWGGGALTRAACLRSFPLFQFQFAMFKWNLKLRLQFKLKTRGKVWIDKSSLSEELPTFSISILNI